MEADKAFGEVLRETRKKRGLSQEKLALDANVDRNYISLIELGKSSPSIKTLFKLCAALESTPSEILRTTQEKIGGIAANGALQKE